jgi:hypothetical protein
VEPAADDQEHRLAVVALRNATRLRWQPKGLTDALDGNNSFPGSMQQLMNLIPDPTTNDSWVPRPAAVSKTTFGSFTTPGFISGLLVVGNIAYGMIASGRNAGKDEPFAYNIATNTFLTVGGILNANTPTSPAATGDWTPPILAQVASRIMVTHPGFTGANKIGWFDVSGFSSNTITGSTNGNGALTGLSSNPLLAGVQPGMTISDSLGDIPANTYIVSVTATQINMNAAATGSHGADTFTISGGTATVPLWGAGDLNVFPLPSVPVGVAQFNGRAYYACGINGIVFSDSGFPTNRTNANQVLTPNNGLPVTAVAPLQLSAPLTGGIVQAIIAFQGVAAMQQILGDPTTNNLSMNLLPVATGTLAPLSIIPTELGTAFISPEGMRVIEFSGQVSPPIGDHGTGVTSPFIYALHPSRTCASSNADCIRISVQNGGAANNPTQEYWYDLTRRVWHGPHSFPASLIQPWNNTFLMSASGIAAKLWTSDAIISGTSVYLENGVQMSWAYEPSLLPDDQEMMMVSVVEASITIAIPLATVTATAIDDLGNVLSQVVFPATSGSTQWDAFSWDVGKWDGSPITYRQRQIAFNQPLVAKQLTIQFSGSSAAGFRIGNLSLRYQKLGYQIEAA